MTEKLKVFDVELDVLNTKEAMNRFIRYMDEEKFSVVEVVTLEMLMQGQNDMQWKEHLKSFDMCLPGDCEIFEAAGVAERGLLRDIDSRLFQRLFLKYLEKNQKRIFLLAESEKELLFLEELLVPYKGIVTAGSAVMPEEGIDGEAVVNEINGAVPDCVISVLSSPWQEKFVTERRGQLNTRVWLGYRSVLWKKESTEKATGRLYHFILKKIFHHQVEKQKNEKD